jgi:hypothetical protein
MAQNLLVMLPMTTFP